MRELLLKNKFMANGISFKERYGISIPFTSDNIEHEYNSVRNAVGLSDFSFLQKYTIPEDKGIDFLNNVFAGNVENLRFGRVLHTFLSDENGNIIADCYIANNDEEFLILCESIVDDSQLDKILFEDNNGADFGLKNITNDLVVLSIDGSNAWKTAKEIFGVSILGLPYLSIEEFQFDGEKINVIRAGKTGEFGYYVIAMNKVAEKLFDTALEKIKQVEGAVCGLDVHNILRLDGRFFNIFSEGAIVRNPLYLGLQWMIDLENMNFIGGQSLQNQREAGVGSKITGMTIEKEYGSVAIGDKICDENGEIGYIVSARHSYELDKTVALALLPFEKAYSGLKFYLKTPDGPVVNTISMPPFTPKSLNMKLD
ncbi:MAG: aminomethyl transferase family protein [Fibrobacter sp.]|nr:aminomethyl transferase family protein [Fibrobacter sp.]